MRVIIIGSGIAGLSTALGLQAVGIETTLYERAPELREVGAGISLWANALRALDYLGVGQTIRSRSLSLERFELRANRGRNVQASFAAKDLEKRMGSSPVVAMIHRADLVEALAASLPAGTARYGFECVGVEPIGNQVLVSFANGQTDLADAVIGADGIKSAVRTAIIGPEEPRYAGYTCWRGISPRPASLVPGYFGEWWGRGQRFGIATLPQDRVYWFAVRNALAGQYSNSNLSMVKDLFGGWANPVSELIANTPPEQLIHNDIIDRPPMQVWSKARVGLIGDAAHPTTPNLGQGGCMAIEDAVALTRAMTHNPNPADAFVAFAAERSRRTAAITNESWQIGTIAHWEGHLACRLRDTLSSLMLPLIGTRNLCKYAAFDIGPLPASRSSAELTQ